MPTLIFLHMLIVGSQEVMEHPICFAQFCHPIGQAVMPGLRQAVYPARRST
jgi:hypothetical protein